MLTNIFANYVVYADILFALNFLMDFFLLWATGRFLRLPCLLRRLFPAALVGALYGVGVVFPQLDILYLLLIKILFPVLLLWIAFPYKNRLLFLRSYITFYLIGFAMAGAVLGGSSLLAQRGIILGGQQVVQWGTLAFAIITAVVLGRRGIERIKKSWQKDDFKINLEIKVAGRSCLIPALIDTGNDLRDPISDKPVIVAEYAALAPLLPSGIRQAYELFGTTDPAKILPKAAIDGWEKRLRLIPFASIGKHHGLLMGFRPDRIVIYSEEKLETSEVIICIYQKKMGKTGDYKAIINPDVLLLSHRWKGVSA